MKKKITIALSGNPNSGKSTVFNAITGARQHIANYPGVTVEKKSGKVVYKGQEIEVVDLPGTYSLTAYSLEELVARNFLVDERPDLVVDIVDASNLDRNLYLAVQLMELGVPMIIALNMVDVAESRGIDVDYERLSQLLDVPVIPMVARSNKGVRELLDKAVETTGEVSKWHPVVISYGMDIDEGLAKIETIIQKSRIFDRKYPPRWRALKCLEGDIQIMELLKRDPGLGERIEEICRSTFKHTMDTLDEDPAGVIADYRYGYITAITKEAVKRKIELRLNLSDKIDRVLTNRVIGPLLMIVILYGIYALTFWASEGPVRWLEAFFGFLKSAVSAVLPQGIIQSLIVSGVIDGVGGVLGFVPLILFMFFAIAIMEDSGYMARVAYMLDRVLQWFGLHGNSVIPLIISGGISGGCAVPGAMATRTLRDPKERIATLLVVPFMNCGAKLPIFAMLIAAFFSRHQARMMFILTLLAWGFALFAAKIMRSTVLRGPKTPFVMELPPYRVPTFRGLIIHAWERTWQYIKKAGTVILAFSVLLWAMMTFPGPSQEEIKAFQDARSKLTRTFLSSPEVKGLVNDQKTLSELRKMPSFEMVEAAYLVLLRKVSPQGSDSGRVKAAERFLEYRRDIRSLRAQEQQAALDKTLAGRIGRALEKITKPLGFDYRVNIALIGGFAAKEVIVSTLGTAYSLSELEAGDRGSISDKLKRDPDWSPLKAFTLIVFIMLYVPCIVTILSIRKESSWVWAGFSIAFNLTAAYLVALGVIQIGRVLGL
jgi:ferrous iron transport protein B